MTHPRLSVSEMCTYPLPFGDELDALGRARRPHRSGVITAKVDAYGRDKAVAALARAVDDGDHGDHRLLRPLGARRRGTRRGRRSTTPSTSPAEIGGCTYFTPGRRDGRSFDELTASLAEAVAPCAAYAASRGRPAGDRAVAAHRRVVRAHAARRRSTSPSAAGIDVIADLGNCWMERDYEDDRPPRRCPHRRRAVRRRRVRHAEASRRRAAAPFPATATCRSTVPRRRARRRLHRRVRAGDGRTEDRGRRPRAGAAAGRRARQRAAGGGPVVSRAIVFNGDETWEMRDLPVPDPQPGGAVLRVEATGLCHSDIDHFRGHVHTPWGGEFPSIAGHEIVGRIEKIRPDGRRRVGGRRGRPGRRARHRHHARRRTGSTATTSRSTRARVSTAGSPSTSSCCPGSIGVPPARGPLGRGAHRVRAAELRGHVGGAGPARTTSSSIEGPGHMGMATIVAARAAGASTVIVTGVGARPVPPRLRAAGRRRPRRSTSTPRTPSSGCGSSPAGGWPTS